ncbi:MAG: RidA family protein [Candidatus Limnocylindria bacterium]
MTERQAISTPDAPAAVGPYSQAIRAGDFIFAAGQIGTDPVSGELVGASVTDQARQVLANLQAILITAGSGLDRAVKTTVFLTDIGDWPAVNEVYAELMPQPYPARSAFAVRDLPKGAKVEIECVALSRVHDAS